MVLFSKKKTDRLSKALRFTEHYRPKPFPQSR